MIRLSFLLLLLSPFALMGQTTFPARPTSSFTYLIPLTNEQLLVLLDKGTHEIPLQHLSQPIDSLAYPGQFDVDQLPNGYYLEVHAQDHYEVRKILSSYRWQSFVVNNDNDLAVIVLDSLGKMIPDAEVRIKNKVLTFDEETKTYRHDHSTKQGILTITYQGHRDYYKISASKGAPNLKRIGQKIAYTPPLRWLWRIPYRFFADPITSIRWRSPVGWIATIIQPFQWEALESRTKGYVVLNQPKYRPGDTVRLKALVLNEKGKPVDSPIELAIIQSYNNQRVIDTLLPYRAGAYEYEFVLHDSLNLTLDTYVNLFLRKKIGQTYARTSFQLEDYELKEVAASFTSTENEIYRGEPFVIKAHMTDQNDLNVPGARIELGVTTNYINKTYNPQVFVPDTLWKLDQVLDPIGSTAITLPDTIFPAADMQVNILAKFLSVDGEVIEQTLNLSRYHDPCRLNLAQQGDSIVAKSIGCKAGTQTARLTGTGANGQILVDREVSLPHQFALRTDIQGYSLTQGERTTSIFPTGANVLILHRRTADSLFARLINPYQLDCWIEVFKEDKSIQRSQGQKFQLAMPANPNKTYHLTISYVWAGRMVKQDYSLQWDPEGIRIETSIPEKIFPGEETTINLSLMRNDGTAVSNADLTAYALTSSFQSISRPPAPFSTIPVDFRKGYNRFYDATLDDRQSQEQLDYWLWAERFGIDSLTAYQFLYPQNGRETFYLEAEAEETQISVFVVKNGIIQPIRYIVMDAMPIFVAGLQREQPYSFPTFQANHKLRIRTKEHLIEADSVWVKDSMKAVFVVDLDHWGRNTRVTEMKAKVVEADRQVIRPHVLSLERSGFPPYSYFQQGRKITPIAQPYRYSYSNSNLYGPFRQSNLTFSVPGNYSLTQPFEPGYSYTFSDSLWKMRSRELGKWQLNGILETHSYQQRYGNVGDEILSEEVLRKRWKNSTIYWNLCLWVNQNQQFAAQKGNGRIVLDGETNIQPSILLLSSNDNQPNHQLFPASFPQFTNLPHGTYRIQVWDFDGRSFVIDSILVEEYGSTHVKRRMASTACEDSTAWVNARDALLDLKFGHVFPSWDTILQFYRELGIIPSSLFPSKYDNGDVLIQVLDSQSLAPIKFAYVQDRESLISNMTNEKGEIWVRPDLALVLEISKPMYQSIEVEIGPGSSKVEVLLGIDKSAALDRYRSMNSMAQSGGNARDLGQNYDSNGVIILNSDYTSSVTYTDALKVSLRGNTAGVMVSQEALLDEVVVTGYGGKRKAPSDSYRINPMDSDADGVPDLYDKEPELPGDPASPPSGGLALAPSSLRSNFRDYAYWKPALRTDENGQARYTVTFPDDITQWEHRVLAYDFDNRRGADLQANSLSYLPLMARLSVPRFLVEGDQTVAFGKVQNVTGDSLNVSLSFAQDSLEPQTQSMRIGAAGLDTLAFTAPTSQDSMSVTFRLEEAESGFFDGEKRDIPLFRRGDRTTEGQFWMLLGDTTVRPTFITDDSVDVTIHASLLDVLLEEMDHIDRYPYYCNEQAASKLKVLLMEKRVRELIGESFTKDHKIKSLIRRLQKNTNEDQLWGWWAGNETLPWITIHVLEALFQAEADGFAINIDKAAITSELEQAIQRPYQYQKIDLLFLLNRLGSDINFEEFITEQEADTNLYLTNRFRLIELRQDRNMPYQLDSLWKYQLSSVRGQLYWPGYQYSLRRSNTEATLLAYRILRKAGDHEEKLQRIQGWLLAQRQETGYWFNTYTSSRVLETILPDLLVDGELPESPTVVLKGQTTQTISEFPFKQTMSLDEVQSISKEGSLPVYASVAQTYFETEPVANDTLFSVRTWWEDKQGDSLTTALEAGQSISLWVEVSSQKSAEYVQIDVPIPGGCSYAEQGRNRNIGEVHREQRRDRVAIFCKELPIGTRRFEVKLQARYPGVYTLNPARVEEMYFPIFFGRTGMGEMRIE